MARMSCRWGLNSRMRGSHHDSGCGGERRLPRLWAKKLRQAPVGKGAEFHQGMIEQCAGCAA
jgi:hypothetical protein